MGVTYVAVDEGGVLGFATIAPGHIAVQMANDYGCIGVCVDARPDAVEFYGRYGFVSIDVVEGQSDARPAPTPMFLAIRAVREAVEGAE